MAVDPAGDWLVCGGSFSPTIYHLSTLSKVIAMDVPKDVVTQTAIFAKERVSEVPPLKGCYDKLILFNKLRSHS